MSDHPIVHIEFSTKDPDASSKFYQEIFGWKIEAIPEMNYTTFEAEPGPGGGFNPVDGEMTNAGDIFVYIQTDDIEASLSKIESLGGSTLLSKTEIPNTGWFALFTDPAGNRVGLYKGMEQAS
jgi:predicted enzyme related to lactoylglutathione lyase